jgi:hypothetical protein
MVASWLLLAHPVLAQIRELPSPAGAGSAQPSLFVAPDGRVYLSWIERLDDGRHTLRFATRKNEGWSAARTIAEGPDWFVNWADFPSMIALPDGSLAAHWLVKNGAGTYAYSVNIVRSTDGGETWGNSRVPHRDGTETEHGFVSLLAAKNGSLGAVWLDGRETRPLSAEHDDGGGDMTLRYVSIGLDGALSDEALLDARVCDCCQTAAAVTAAGPVVVYRDRSLHEVRDISIVRLSEGTWSEPRRVSADDWQIQGCPVNGPSIAAIGRRIAVAWFTAASDTSRVKLAFSSDAGASFGSPVVVDEGMPLGRVDTVLLGDGSALVSWIQGSPAGSSLRVRRIRADGQLEAPVTIVPAGAGLSNGFPQMVLADGTLVLAWTAGRVRTGVMVLP